MSTLIDILLAAVFIAAFIYWHNRGIIKSVWKIAALVITVILVMLLKNPATEYVQTTPFADNLNQSLSKVITVPPGGGVNIAENLRLPDFVQEKLEIGIESSENTSEAIKAAAVSALTKMIIIIGVCVALFIIIRLMLMVVFIIVSAAAKLPVINGANRFLGGILGVVNILFIVYLALMLLTMLTPTDNGLYNVIEHSYFVKYLYNHNILLKLFMR